MSLIQNPQNGIACECSTGIAIYFEKLSAMKAQEIKWNRVCKLSSGIQTHINYLRESVWLKIQVTKW